MAPQPAKASACKAFGMMAALAGAAIFCSDGRAVCSQDQEVRPPAVAGAFYPASAPALARMVADAIRNAGPARSGAQLIALLVPHAGYAFSAPVAAAGYKMLRTRDYDTVYVIGAAHYANLERAATWVGKAFRTPLGDYPVDTEAVKELLLACPAIREQPEAWVQEHSVEVQIPFLQQVLPKAKLVPLLLGEASGETLEQVAQALAIQARRRHAVLIASSDLSHYPSQSEAERIDREMLRAVATLDHQAVESKNHFYLSQRIPQLACTMCGLSAVELVMRSACLLGANRADILRYANSGEVSQDQQRVVGYGALALRRDPEKPESSPSATETLSAFQQRQVLALAREAIAAHFIKTERKSLPPSSAWLLAKRAVFVTLKKRGNLRGCIGITEPRLSLYQAVTGMARAAAFEDPRFPSLQAGELPDIDIEVSILSPLRRIASAGEIQLGRHGVAVRSRGKSGLFLPQVASETGWSREVFLNELCSQKAGLAPDAWKWPDTELYVFTVQAFQQRAPGK